ncbi:MAG TPA: ABC transporter ATP-binding protein [Anaerolineaceae bacterium]
MGVLSGLNAEAYDRKYSDRTLARRSARYFRGQARRLTLLAGGLMVVSLTSAAQPIVVSRGIDLLNQVGAPLVQYFLIPGIVLVVSVLTWLANYLNRRVSARAINDVMLQLRTDAFDAAVHHDLSFYDELSSGRMVSRITTDTQDFGKMVTLLTDLISQFVETMVLAVVLVRIQPRLALYIFALVPVVFAFTISYRRMARRFVRAGMQAMANVNATIKETVSGISVAKNFRQERAIYNEFDYANHQSYTVNIRRGLVYATIFPILNAIGGIATAALVYFGGMSVEQGIVTAGAWYLFILSLDRFLFPVMNLSSFWTQIQNGLSAAERVFALIDAEPKVVQTESRPVLALRGKIDFEQVCFRYSDKEQVLEDFSLHIRPGENIAVVGHTGAGKSSVAKLVARFYEFQEGRLLVDDLDIRSFDLDDYRRHLGIVSQVPFLFSGSVAENIRYARPAASASEIEQIARQIGDGDWLETLPNGLETQVGERGARLSMGQRQLVALMRVLVQRPAIFILDEATASIDPFTEWQIQQALNLILQQSTSILIAHRLSTVKSADRIIVMEKGGIIEEGNHEGLLQRGGHYATLYNTYFRHQSLAYVEQARAVFGD